MVARVRHQHWLTVSFWRGGECEDSAVIKGDEAYNAAVRLLGKYRPLRHDDRLIVTEDLGDELPEVSRSSHHSG